MKNLKKLFLVLVTTFIPENFLAQNILYPQVWFNKNDAVKKLELGNTSITGEAFTRENSGVVGAKYKPAKGTKVLLFPVTDYVMEYYNLRTANENVAIVMSEEAFSYRVETTTDSDGNFTFKQMKPGKYMIMCNLQFVGTASKNVEVGRTNYYNGYGANIGSTPIYQSYMYNYNGEHFLSKFVEVKEGEKIVEANLKPKFFAGAIRTGSVFSTIGSTRCGRVNNLMFGKCTEYYANGNPRIVAKWSEGAQNGPTIEYYETGEVFWKGTFKNGKIHGKATYYNKDGSIKENQKYVKGLLAD